MKRVLLNVLAGALMVVAFTACGGGSGSSGSGSRKAMTLEEFTRRFNEASFGSVVSAHYAASNKSLEEFKRRYNEVYNDGFLGNDAPRAIYAASNKNLDEFKP